MTQPTNRIENLKNYDEQKKNIEFIEDIIEELYKKYKLPFKIIVSIIVIIIIFPIIWSWVLPFYCNDSIIYSLIELLLIIFIYGLFLPLIGNIFYIAWKLSNCESYRNT